jgi:hypothetical protein
LKKSFRELLFKINFHVVFLLDVVVCCILYNMILERKGSNIATLMARLELEVDQYFVDPSCVHSEGIEHCMLAKHGTDIETKLQ